MTITSHYTQVCLDAFVNCENLLNNFTHKPSNVSSHIAKLLKECAHICMGTFYAIKSDSINTSKLAVLCIGICDECASACESVDANVFKQCAQACRNCSEIIGELAFNNLEF